MQPLSPISLETEKVCLRPLASHDFDDFLAQGQDQNLWHWLLDNYCLNGKKLTNWFNLATYHPMKQLPLVIIDKASGEFAGSTRLFNLDFNNHKMEIGHTFVISKYQRSYVNSHAKFLLLEHAFETLGAQRVELRTHELNTRSRNAIARLGASFEGIIRQDRKLVDGSFRNSALFSIVKEEWPALKQQQLTSIKEHAC